MILKRHTFGLCYFYACLHTASSPVEALFASEYIHLNLTSINWTDEKRPLALPRHTCLTDSYGSIWTSSDLEPPSLNSEMLTDTVTKPSREGNRACRTKVFSSMYLAEVCGHFYSDFTHYALNRDSWKRVNDHLQTRMNEPNGRKITWAIRPQ